MVRMNGQFNSAIRHVKRGSYKMRPIKKFFSVTSLIFFIAGVVLAGFQYFVNRSAFRLILKKIHEYIANSGTLGSIRWIAIGIVLILIAFVLFLISLKLGASIRKKDKIQRAEEKVKLKEQAEQNKKLQEETELAKKEAEKARAEAELSQKEAAEAQEQLKALNDSAQMNFKDAQEEVKEEGTN